ncbi:MULTISPECIES: hypothetical protein [unclassified Streptomyces]|uniref:hypothetical protein n=1 Tax=unclassified Streptomyces TaxID=2593676 RepID=UPI00070BF8B8|nr:hypothetical protein [Streptomyces sp. Root1310]KQX77047.1 hypothetical protein ASD48_38335 [Streptomyces sp. Root1310]
MIETAAAALSRGNFEVDADGLDGHLFSIVEKAAGSLHRDRHRRDFPHAANADLLTMVAALRDVLGFSPTPTGAEVKAWEQRQGALKNGASAERVGYPVTFLDGPYEGVELMLEGPSGAYPEPGDPLGWLVGEKGGWVAGPLAYVPLSVEGPHAYTQRALQAG